MSTIDRQYILLLSPKLERFKKKSEDLFNFRCPHCGDSKTNKSKARGYVYRVKNDLFYKCHNCGIGQSLGNLIKSLDPSLYKEYVMARYKTNDTNTPKPDFKFKPVKFDDKKLKELKKFSELENHPSYKFLLDRKIPREHFKNLYLCDKFMKWTNSIVPNKFPNIVNDHPRLIIPFLDVHGKMFAYQGRSFGKENPRYFTIKIDTRKKSVFGLDRVNLNEHIYIVEGPLDSLFLPNSLAVAGSDMMSMSKQNTTIVFDNEPRNKQIVDKMYKVIDAGFNICIWPKNISEKDINDMVISSKLTTVEIKTIIDNNTYTKQSALQKVNDWKLC